VVNIYGGVWLPGPVLPVPAGDTWRGTLAVRRSYSVFRVFGKALRARGYH
jgi:hypothetical protein